MSAVSTPLLAGVLLVAPCLGCAPGACADLTEAERACCERISDASKKAACRRALTEHDDDPDDVCQVALEAYSCPN
jgi:hypothetical protein